MYFSKQNVFIQKSGIVNGKEETQKDKMAGFVESF